MKGYKILSGQSKDPDVEKVQLHGIRPVIHERLTKAQERLILANLQDNANVTSLWRARELQKYQAEMEGTHLTFLPYYMKAASYALSQEPRFNTRIDDEAFSRGEIRYDWNKNKHNIGYAVSTDRGLTVVNIKDVASKSLFELADEIQKQTYKARKEPKTLTLDEINGGTFTLSNIGTISGTHAFPLPNYPEIAILAAGSIENKLVPAIENEESAFNNGLYETVLIKSLPLSLTFDHRFIDGDAAAYFLKHFKEYMQSPEVQKL